jgi:hypothetical protein
LDSNPELPVTEGTASGKRAPIYSTVLALALAAAALLLLFVQLASLPNVRDGHVDFRNLYVAGYMVRTGQGHEIYDAAAQKTFQDKLVSRADVPLLFIRPAYQALLFVPFSLLPFLPAYFAFFTFNLAILPLSFLLVRPYLANLSRALPWLPVAMFLYIPIAAALMQGQDSIILLTLLAGALACIERDREYLAGVLVAFGLFKFQLVIPIAVLFLVWRRWRFSAGFAGAAAVLAAVSIWIAGIEQSVHYFRSMMQVSVSQSIDNGVPLRVNIMANLHGAVHAILGQSSLTLPLTIAASAATMIYCAIRRPHGADALLIAIPASVLVSYYLFVHDLCILLIPILLTLDRLAGAGKAKYRFGRTQAIAAVLMFAAPACLLFATNQFWIAALPLIAFTFTACVRQSTDLPEGACA